ncbi:4Fe-4S ferredoxin [Clostridia bacterium]|nr:4Fe-4S ferredoxin [Clostridia bacterium]
MKKVYVNEKWCLGCHLCEYYCAFAATGGKDFARALKDRKIHPNIHVEENEADHISYAVNCRHCDDPLCVKGCITGALTKNADGVVTIDKDKCIGCFTCIVSCPFGAVAPSGDGPVKKCELCVSIADGEPMCVKGCPNAAIVFEER